MSDNEDTSKKPITIVDPPSGWQYGFPLPLEEDYEAQLRGQLYPEKDIPFALKHSRYWVKTYE